MKTTLEEALIIEKAIGTLAGTYLAMEQSGAFEKSAALLKEVTESLRGLKKEIE